MAAPTSNGHRITGAPPGAQPVHVLGTVAVTVPLDPYLDLKALAGYLSLSRRTIQDLVNDPQDPLPTFRVGAKLLARRSEVDGWMAKRRNRKPLEVVRQAVAMAQDLLHAGRHPKKPLADQQIQP